MSKQLSDLEWLWLAASDDESRPVLCGINIQGEIAEATDGQRLHRVHQHKFAFKDAVIGRDGVAITTSAYPKTEQLFAKPAILRPIDDLYRLKAAARAAAAATEGEAWSISLLTFLAADGQPVYVRGKFVLDVLAMQDDWAVGLFGPHEQIIFAGKNHSAVVMPVRLHGNTPIVIPADEYLKPLPPITPATTANPPTVEAVVVTS